MNKILPFERYCREVFTGLEVHLSNPDIEFDFSYVEHIAELLKGVKW